MVLVHWALRSPLFITSDCRQTWSQVPGQEWLQAGVTWLSYKYKGNRERRYRGRSLYQPSRLPPLQKSRLIDNKTFCHLSVIAADDWFAKSGVAYIKPILQIRAIPHQPKHIPFLLKSLFCFPTVRRKTGKVAYKCIRDVLHAYFLNPIAFKSPHLKL